MVFAVEVSVEDKEQAGAAQSVGGQCEMRPVRRLVTLLVYREANPGKASRIVVGVRRSGSDVRVRRRKPTADAECRCSRRA